MHRVLAECDNASRGFAADPVHDLRVALRRCRSMSSGLRTLDPYPAWKKAGKAGKQLFERLGALRDVQVMAEWMQRLGAAYDPVTIAVLAHTQGQEEILKQEAAAALAMFDRKQWEQWCEVLPARTERVQLDSLAFQHLALERWQQARNLHHQALRNRTKVSLHQLRIGLKKFRYIVENFLPELHRRWSKDLKEIQDLLGDIHDLDVLWAVLLATGALSDADAHSRWQAIIAREREVRVNKYRKRMLGRDSLWQVWRAGLPQGSKIEEGALDRLRAWASALDPDFSHASRVSKLALQFYDGLTSHIRKAKQNPRARSILQAAALLHEVGMAKREKNHHKASYRLILKLDAPLGWEPAELHFAALVARYHRGALPSIRNKQFAALSATQKRQAILLAGILRLADSVDRQYDGKVRNLRVEESGEYITVWADGKLENCPPSERVAAARHLLETAYQCPILARPGPLRSPRKDTLHAA